MTGRIDISTKIKKDSNTQKSASFLKNENIFDSYDGTEKDFIDSKIDEEDINRSNDTIKNQDITLSSVDHIPRQYISLHVRFGSKVLETPSQPLSKYMNIIMKKFPHTKVIFISI